MDIKFRGHNSPKECRSIRHSLIPLWFTDLLFYTYWVFVEAGFWVLVSEGDFVKILNLTVESRADLRNEKEERKLKFF